MDSDGLFVGTAFFQFKGKKQMNMDSNMISLPSIFWNQSESNEIHVESNNLLQYRRILWINL